MRLPFLIAALITSATAHAEAVTGWTVLQGTPSPGITDADTGSPVVGGDANGADSVGIAGAFPKVSLLNAGDSIGLSGTVLFAGTEGTSSFANQFRFGLFDLNGQSANTGWLGYYASNSADGGIGDLRERNAGNAAIAISSTGTTQVQTFVATGSPAFDTAKTYAFGLTFTRQADNSLNIAWSLNNAADGGAYSLSGTWNDTSPLTYAFDRVAFLSGGNMNADTMRLTNVDVSFTSVPEPSGIVLTAAGAASGLIARRRRQARTGSR